MVIGISVIIPCFNAAPYLRDTIESVLNQDYQGAVEVLITDDSSTDGSREIAESIGPPVRVLSKPSGAPRNAAASRNCCLRAAKQPLVAFLDADDFFLPGHLSALSSAFVNNPELGMAYANGSRADIHGHLNSPMLPDSHMPRTSPELLALDQCFVPAAVMVRRSVFDKVGLFDETLRHVEDHDMWLRILEKYSAKYVPHQGYAYRQHEGQKSLKPTLWEDAEIVFKRACARYPYPRSVRRKRKAVLAYRKGEIAWKEHHRLRSLKFLAQAAIMDPIRAWGQLRASVAHV